jgi:Spx/MgsR family transcriptional regulator
MITLYGIPNCDTIKKARKWLEKYGIDYQFHDFRKDGLDSKQLKSWVKELGWETLLNRRGMTWRKLTDEQKDSINEKNAMQLMINQPAIIKRPVLDLDGKLHVGFKEAEYQELFGV